MSEGEKQTMDKKSAVARQLPTSTQRDVGNCTASRYVKQSVTARKDLAGGVRQTSDFSSQPRKSQQTVQQSKNRVFDKRVRAPRGTCSNDTKEEVTNAETPAELECLEAWGSKKRNLNHLLNFHYESRDLYNGSHWKGAGLHANAGKSSSRRGYSRGSAPFNKERFLQANCQFVVRAGKDYAVHASDPDMLVDWELIEQVCICSHEVPSCPICLFAPVAAKITRCGHIYCWSCMLHYLSLDDRTWRKCPICYEAVHEKDLKSVTSLEKHQYAVGEQMVMKLMKKARGSTLVMPAADWRPDESFPVYVNGSRNSCYAKLLVAEVSDVKNIVLKERKELEQQLKDEGESSLEASYISAALDSLMEREHTLLSSKPTTSRSLADMTCSSASGIEKRAVHSSDYGVVLGAVEAVETASPKTEHCYLSAFDEIVTAQLVDTEGSNAACSSEEMAFPETAADNYTDSITKELSVDMSEMMESLVVTSECDLIDDGSNLAVETSYKNRQTDSDDAFYFYQAADGQHVYMHALNIRCLVKQYGSLRNCPDTVTATVLEMEPVSMDEDLRRRLRYLNHLPLTCEFVMAELELKPPLVTQQVLDEFADDLEKRYRNRVKRARDDKRRAYCIQREENRKMGIDPTMRIVRSEYVRPTLPLDHCAANASDSSSELPLVSSPGNQQQTDELSNRNQRTESTSSQDSVTLPSVPSFAEMLKIGKAKTPTEAWPVRSAQKMVDSGGRERSTSGDNEGSGSEEYMLMAPRHHASLSDAIQAALDSYSKGSDNPVASDQCSNQTLGAGSASTSSKKKKTKKLLFSTGLPRNN